MVNRAKGTHNGIKNRVYTTQNTGNKYLVVARENRSRYRCRIAFTREIYCALGYSGRDFRLFLGRFGVKYVYTP